MIIGIGGTPGSGKTTIIRNIIKKADDWITIRPIVLVDAIFSNKLNCYILGKYAPYYEVEGYAEGTDKLSMAVAPKAKLFFESLTANCLFEGDRLFTANMIKFIIDNCEDKKFYILETNFHDIVKRFKARGSNQSLKFLKSRYTKYGNIQGEFKIRQYLKVLKNNSKDELEYITKRLEKDLNVA